VTDGNNLTNVTKFNKVVNKKYHDAPATFNAAGDYMVVTRNIYNDDKLSDNKLWLYESNLVDGQYWSEPVPLYFNDDHFSNGQATLSPDGQVMYFTSDRPGGFGGTDIYKSVKGKDGKWGAPENLGDKINTEGNEMFPYYDAKGGYLFFSSNGLPGLGGLDIFVSKVKRDGSFTKPINMGAPINSNKDDFSFVYKQDGSGFLSSNRSGGKGDDDIYSFKNMAPFQDKVQECYLSGTVTDKVTHEPLMLAKVVLLDANNNKLKEAETKADGKYEFGIDCGNTYNMMVMRDGYNDAKAHIDTKKYNTPNVIKNYALENPASKIEEKEQLCDHKLPVIYYDLDKFYIRYKDKLKLDQVVALMNKYPEMKLEVASYTDARASKPYNVKLSENRTKSAVNYLVTHGISKDRIVAKWYGELYPVNGCVDGVKCSEAEYQLNRRTEFKILNCE
jgi:outer membrane protein OmpA-like peptidoglycan-associated protein